VTRPMIEMRDVAKWFGATCAVRGISFTVQEGEIVGFLGPNGAGKTTTMRMLAGVFPPTHGTVRIAGHDATTEPLACRRLVGYCPENAPHYPELTVTEYLRFVARVKRIPRAARDGALARALAACALEVVAARRIGTLSKGYRQRVGLAQALLGDPAVLVLDEPTIGLDPGQVVEIRDLIGGLRGSRTVLFSSHVLSEVEALCERVIVVARGALVGEGTAAELGSRLGARQRVVVRVDGPADAVAAALRAIPGVDRVDVDHERFVVEASGQDGLARRVGEAVQRGGWPVVELRHEALDLEDIFLSLVRGERA
jgi:gliding motility-associated transport system ATP-binding protein